MQPSEVLKYPSSRDLLSQFMRKKHSKSSLLLSKAKNIRLPRVNLSDYFI